MANTRPRFFIYAPDNTKEGTLDKRLSVRAKHLETATANFGSGFVRVAGALVTPESIASPDAPKKMVGSAFICEAEHIDQVWEMLKKDIYYTSGVWDVEKIVVLPYMIATPFNI
ncbi:hypothetical protein AGABI1DRAFT_83753 [Agaricus bisporus var. burnettii JB137-S8]|uniref:YCII-related domain-containing protein n=1 Tax=Agaricus bisporus var. burnettii (strain JB137-S8 / ATCC MYA-4627 / FGSC 10392) TaxID=597362 RepID=K5XBW3_AGABU|nr:uncharacterized protein AGABI1DRAFT_83753 [Agaricus bisporus var. burnettii JB137-S8]EKM80793.1 hypothetical protein AGABI1DRAFT_83753 [Agaricus bisporus var. burnettii JB137-S8]